MSPTGVVKTIIRADVAPEPVSDADFREYAKERAARFGTSVTEKGLEMLHQMSLHDRLPVLDTLMFDDGNNLWAVEFAHPGAKTRRVTVYDTSGALRGVLELPTTMTPLSAETGRIVVLMRDESGAEMVNVFDILTSVGRAAVRSGSLLAGGAPITHPASTSRSTPAVVSTTG
jgi:hypothetical protein